MTFSFFGLPLLLALLVSLVLLPGCADGGPGTETDINDYSSEFINLVDFFPYLSRAFETSSIRFSLPDAERLGYGLEGFSVYRDQLPRTWAVQKESTVVVYFTELEDKTVTLKCRPFNPPGRPHQVGEVFINGVHLTTIEFKDKGRYEFRLPGASLRYGSNRLTFRWQYVRRPVDFSDYKDKRPFAVGFSLMEFRGESRGHKPRKKLTTIGAASGAIRIPHGGIVEYFADLPKRSCLSFTLSPSRGHPPDSRFGLVVYGEKGEPLSHEFDFPVGSASRSAVHRFNLDCFGGQTVKIAFINTLRNHPNFTVDLTDAGIYTPAVATGSGSTDLADSGGARRPHVFIYLVDTLRADHLGSYGYERETDPNIAAFSKSGVLFGRCFAAASWTRPAVGSVLTGLYPGRHRAQDRQDRMSPDARMITEILKDHGYGTIYITPNANCSREMNFDQGVDFYRFSIGGRHGGDFYRTSEYLNREFFEIIEQNPHLTDKPIFAYLHSVDPHDPYTPQAPFLKFKAAKTGNDTVDREREKLGDADVLRQKHAAGTLTDGDLDYVRGLYDCEILHNDHYFGEFIDFLKARGLYEDSLIIFVADHGEQFGEHGGLFHGHSIYNEEIHVPLIMKFPGGRYAGRRSDAWVSQVDIVPTILEVLGISEKTGTDGVGLLGLLAGGGDDGRYIYVQEELNDDRNRSNFVGVLEPGGKRKHILRYSDSTFTGLLGLEVYGLDGDFGERKDGYRGSNRREGGMFELGLGRFLGDYFLWRQGREKFKEAEQVDFKKLDPEKIKQLKALGYLN